MPKIDDPQIIALRVQGYSLKQATAIVAAGGIGGSGGGGAVDLSAYATIQALSDAAALLQDKATAATDAELSSAITTLQNAITAKQDSSTAATDAELASAVATLNTTLASKQDSGTAATDAELSSAVATLNAQFANYATAASLASSGAGVELGYIERTSSDTTTNTSLTDGSLAANTIPSLVLSVVGAGRPVEFEFYTSQSYNSTVAAMTFAVLLINGVQSSYGLTTTSTASKGFTASAKRRIVLSPGVSYDIAVGKAVTAGTGTFVATVGAPMYLSATQK
jgi:hypothetical protein